MAKIKSLLKAVWEQEETIMEELHQQIGVSPNIAWYPSAGLDFRDLIEVNRTKNEPDIFFHTDYSSNSVKLKCGLVFNDERTKVFICRITELEFRKKINYLVSPEYVDIPEDPNPVPKIYLLDVKVESDFGELNKPVIYFFMENINFLDEILLKNKINLSHFIKVREGCGYGGNKKSISITYAFLGELKVKHILVDEKEDTDKELIKSISRKHDLQPRKYELKNISQRRDILDWSGNRVKVLDVVLTDNEKMSEEDLNKVIEIIRKN